MCNDVLCLLRIIVIIKLPICNLLQERISYWMRTYHGVLVSSLMNHHSTSTVLFRIIVFVTVDHAQSDQVRPKNANTLKRTSMMIQSIQFTLFLSSKMCRFSYRIFETCHLQNATNVTELSDYKACTTGTCLSLTVSHPQNCLHVQPNSVQQ